MPSCSARRRCHDARQAIGKVSEPAPDRRVPAYLGRVLDADGEPAGTCFQVAPGIVATAWHVLNEVGAGAVDAEVAIDPLPGGESQVGTVVAIDPAADLAVVRLTTPLEASIAGLAATDNVAKTEPVDVTGVSQIDDPGHMYRFLDGPGTWGGATLRGDAHQLGWMACNIVTPGMSGAPVRRRSDDVVVGVVSGRYNSADRWMRDCVWVARSERLLALCVDIAPVALEAAPVREPIDVLLTVDASQVRLTGGDIDVCADHGDVSPGLANAVDETRRARANAGARREVADDIRAQPGTVALDRAGRLLTQSFLPGPIAAALAERLERAEAAYQPLRLGIACAEARLQRLPWEALADPRTEGPLALRPLVGIHRRVAAAGTPAAVPGPLRILVAIASPDDSSPLLDYERELRNVLTAVGAARDGSARVRIVPFATTAQIHAALEVEAVHVLHISGHGSPGSLVIEHDDGSEREIGADKFVDEAIPAGKMPAVIALAACYTNTADATGAPSFAARLAERGAAVVIASETSVTDIYATKAFARIYGRLAEAGEPDAVAAVADARRTIQGELEASTKTREQTIAGLGEWAVLSVLAGAGSVAILDPAVVKAPAPPPQRFAIGRVSARAVGEFVGRRRAQRRLPGELLAAGRAGVVLHGIGGIGKTTLAAELAARVIEREPERQPVVLEGALGFESVLGAIVSALRLHLISTDQFVGRAATVLGQAARSDLPWAERLKLLRMVPQVATVPLLVVLDNFEDNLTDLSNRASLRESTLAELLAVIAAEPGAWRLLVTSRYTFELPDDAARALTFHPVGALSAAETHKLIWSLPALDRQLDDAQVEQVWRMLGGHPRSLEYLDALLSDGGGRYLDIERRLETAFAKKLGGRAGDLLKTEWELDTALAEVATLAADDVLLDDLLASLASVPGARELLVGASVYREPVDLNALLFQVGEPDDDAASIPDREGAEQQIREILDAAGIPTDKPVEVADLPAVVQAAITPHLGELDRMPMPPRRPPEHVQEQVDACRASTLLSIATADAVPLAFVHRWTATELERRLAEAGEREFVARAHRHAADYWLWRVEIWPQAADADFHHLIEARYHLLGAGDLDAAEEVTRGICSQLYAWSAWEHEAEIVLDTLARLPLDDRAATWIMQLGLIAHNLGNLSEAETQYRRSLDISERLGNQDGMAASHGNLGNLARERGDLSEAEARYRRSLDIYERLGSKAGMAATYGSLGILARNRGDLTDADAQYRRSVDIDEIIGNRAGMAGTYQNLGNLAHDRGDLTEAETQYRRALDICEELGNQAGMAAGYRNLGMLADKRGDFTQAETQYRRSLDISERIGDQAEMAVAYRNLGDLAGARGDLTEAETQHRRSLDINERLGNQAGIATTHLSLVLLAHARGDLTEAETQCRRALDINERLGNQAGMAASIGALGTLAAERGEIERAIGLHGRALLLRAGMGIPVEIDVHILLELRPRVAPEVFLRALAAVAGDDQAGEIVRALDELEGAGDSAE